MFYPGGTLTRGAYLVLAGSGGRSSTHTEYVQDDFVSILIDFLTNPVSTLADFMTNNYEKTNWYLKSSRETTVKRAEGSYLMSANAGKPVDLLYLSEGVGVESQDHC